MSDHDDLAGVVSKNLDFIGGDPYVIADDVIEAGWRPAARVIRDRAELDALPVGSVVMHFPCPDTAACVWARIGDCWTTNGDDRAYSAEDIAEGHLHYSGAGDNLILLHTPENGDTP